MKMNKVVMQYYIEKFKRGEIKEAAVKATINKESLHVQVGGRGIELIEIVAQLVGTLMERSNLTFDVMAELLKAELEMEQDLNVEHIKEDGDRKDIIKLFNEIFKDLDL